VHKRNKDHQKRKPSNKHYQMKKTTAVVLLSLCTGMAAWAQKDIKISGTIINPADVKLTVANATNINIVPENKQEAVTLSPEGKFTITIPVSQKYNWIILALGQGQGQQRIDFFVKEGSELNVTADGKNLDSTASFQGKGSDVPQYFANLSKTRGGIIGYYKRTQEIAELNSDTYLHGIDSIRADEENYMKNNNLGKALPKDFQAYWSAFLKYSVYDAMLHYPGMHESMRLKTNNIPSIPPELFVITRKTPAVFDDNLLDIAFYQTYVQSYYSSVLAANGYNNIITNNPKTGEQDRTQALQLTDSVLHLLYANAPKKTAEFGAGRILATESRNPGQAWTLAEVEARNAAYKKNFPKSANNAVLDKIAYDIKKFNPGQPALDFAFKTIEGKDVKLSDLKGKVVYMDFWASWCGPCKGEMPHAKEVKEHFKDRNDVVFLYVSIDDKEEAWKRGIQAMSIAGIHTRTPGWGGEIAKLYQISSIPAYFLIDKKGNFVIEKTPRPSQTQELIKLMEGLL
jgi:thiol-disulfide isomerase/thioredoxin